MSSRPVEAAEAGADEPVAPGVERDRHRQRIVGAVEGGEPSFAVAGRLATLAGRFGLNSLEADLLAVLWVSAFDPELRSVLANAEPLNGQITVRLVAGLLGHPARVRLPSESPLLSWRMVREHELVDGGAALTVDPGILAWLEGEHELDRALAGRARLLAEHGELADWPIDSTARLIRSILEEGRRLRLHIASCDSVAARWFAGALGRRLGMHVLDLPPGALAGDPEGALRLHRQAFLDGCIPCLAIEDADLSCPSGILPYPLQILHGEGCLPAPAAGVQDVERQLPPPGPEERERLWRRLWPESGTWPARALAELALCHEADVADIAAAAATAPADARLAAQALRERGRGDLGPLARRVEASFDWNDLVLPEAVRGRLEDIAFEARERGRLWAEPQAARLFPYGRGLVALFAGPPGTGKTMAAQVIAGDLGLDLLAVDLSAVISKWVGETSQHLQQLLSSRAAQRSVLFFDEADALYARRVEELRDAQDRFANIDTSHLMTALEAYPGIVFLATNLKANIDGAFVRRIRHVIDFPTPDEPAREQIWLRAVKALFPRDQARRLRPHLARLARIEASGALIKNAALSALFASRRLERAPDLGLLADMLVRELAKEGVAISPRDLESALEDRR